MHRDRVPGLLTVLADKGAVLRARKAAAIALTEIDERRAAGALLAIAQDEAEDQQFAAIAGELLACISLKRAEISTVPLEDFSAAAYLAFDAAIAAQQR
jgi:HEAT repeat protein